MRRGLTMLEILVAAAVLSIGLLGAIEVVARCAATSRRVEDHARAMLFARSKMDEILKEPILQAGTDRGEGVDTSTDYDWEASIEQSQHPTLMLVTVLARHRITGEQVVLTTLRRPDISTPAEAGTTGGADTTGTGTASPAGAGGATL